MNKLKYAAFLVTLSMGAALAATAPGTSITNTASASYTDPDGGAQTVSSNTVSTTINPLGSFTITLDQTAAAAPSVGNDQGIAGTLKLTGVQGQQVVFPYVIANTGNYNDTYTLGKNFVNGSAIPTGLTAADYKFYPELGTTGTPDLTATAITSIAVNAGASKNFYMVVTVPTTAPTGSIAYADPVGTATVTTVNNTNGAVGAFTATVTPPTENNNNFQFNKLTVNAQANLTVTKAFNKFYSAYTSSTTNTPVTGAYTPKVGDFVEYTITVTNTSASSIASSVSIADVVPAGTQYVDGSTSSGTVTPAAPVAAGATVTATPASGEIATSGVVTLKYVFKVLNLADTTATPDGVNDPVVNAAKASYKDKTTGTSLPDVTGTATGINVVAVGVGPSGNPTGAASGTVTATTQPAPNATGLDVTKSGTGIGADGTGGAGNDLSTITRAVVKADGTTTDILFPNTLKNTGTLTDQFSLSSSVGANLTTGTPTVSFYKDAAGTTLLTAADLNLAPGASLTYYTKVTLPAATPSVDGTAAAPALSVIVTATSGNNASVKDTTTDVLEDTNRNATLVGNNTSTPLDNNGTPDVAKLVKNVNPVAGGVEVSYQVDLVNKGLTADTVTPSGSISIPRLVGADATPTVTYYLVNADGSRGAQITSTFTIPAGAEVTVVAVFTVPADAAPTAGTAGIPLTQTFASTLNGSIPFTPDTSDTGTFTKGDLLTIGVTNGFTFSPDASSRITASGSTVYTHTLTNNSTNTNITGVVFAVALDTAKTTTTLPSGSGLTDTGASLDTGAQTDFTTTYSLDGVNYSATLPSPGTIAPGASITLYVKVADTSSTNVGSVNDVVLSATPSFSAGTNPAAQLVEDVTVVKAMGLYNGVPADNTDFALKPLKTVRTCADALCATVLNATGATAVPGNFLEYTIVSKNNRLGASDLKGVIVKDTVPTNTTFVSASATTDQTGTVLYSSDGGTTWSGTAPTGATVTQLWVGVNTAAPATSIDTSDVLSTAKTITVKFVVKVN